MRKKIINLIKTLSTKGQPDLEGCISELAGHYHKKDWLSSDRKLIKGILEIFCTGYERNSRGINLDEPKAEPSPKDPKLMTLAEAWEKASSDETIKCKGKSFSPGLCQITEFTLHEATQPIWQIISSDPKVSPKDFVGDGLNFRGVFSQEEVRTDEQKTLPNKTTQITKKECYHIQIGNEDFGDFRVESEWEGFKNLITNDTSKLFHLIIMEDTHDSFSIIKGSPVIMMAMLKESNTEVSLGKYIDWVADAHACLSDLFMKYFDVEIPRDGTTLVPKIMELEKLIKNLKENC